MGEVFRAKDPRLGRDVVIKGLHASVSADVDRRLCRFEQEARAVGVLNRPHVTAVCGPGVVQELLEGESLQAEIAAGRLSSRKATDDVLQIQGLASRHDEWIVQRDLKPGNLSVTKE
jgi:serine/threonine protein kinase